MSIKVEKANVVLSIDESELEYYKGLGFKKLGEKEAVEKTVSASKYEKLVEENDKNVAELEAARKEIDEKEETIKTLTAEKEDLVKKIAELEAAPKGGK